MSRPQSLTSRCIALEDTRSQSNQSNQSNPAFEDDSDPFVVNGVALGEGDVTVGASQTATYWPPPVLREAAPKLEGVPIVVNNSADSHDPGSQPPVSDIVGEVTDAAYADGVGIIYQGEVDDREIARKIDRGRVDVSPVMARELGDYSETHDARVAESIPEFRDLGIVFEGASDDASIETGPNASAAVLSDNALAGEALAAAFDTPVPGSTAEALAATFGTTDPAAVAEALAESDALASIGDLSEGTIVRWEASGGTAFGRVRRTIESEDATFDSEIDGDVTVSGPAALITVYRPGDDGYEATDQQVAHKPDTLTVIESFPATDANAASHAQRGDERAEPDDERSDTRADDSDSDTTPESDMTLDLTDDEEALIHAARSTETPTVVDAEDEALARQATDLRIDQFDDPTVVETATYDALEARVESVEGVLADALADQTGISESAAHSLDLDALVAEFEDDEGNLDAEALVQSPETGGAGDADDPRDDPGGSPGDLDAEDRETVRDNLRRADLLESRTPDHAEALRSEAAALVGVEEAEDIDMEAL